MAKPSKRFAASQTRLLEAAGEVFAEKGYEAATVREICRRADVANIAAVNYYFGDKEKLYVAVVKHAYGAAAEPATADGPPAELPPRQKLREAIRRMAEALVGGCRPAWQLQLMGRELACPSPACAAVVRELVEPHYREVLTLLDDVLPAETPAETRRLTALSIVGQVVHHRCAAAVVTSLVGDAEAATYTADRLAEQIADFSLAALGLAEPIAIKRAI
jgi:AcrR family transcriptional regulator